MEINDWKNRVVSDYKEKFQNQDWSMQDRILGTLSQLSSLGEKVQFNQGLRKHDKQHETEEMLVACIMLDVLMLAGKLNVDLDKGLEEMLLGLTKIKR